MTSANKITSKDLKKFNYALQLQNRGEFKSAIHIYESIYISNPSIIEIKLNLATCFFGTEDFLRAAQLFHALHIEDPDNAVILNYCAVTYLKLNQNQLALDFLKRLVNKEPSNLDAWVNLTYVANLLNNNTDSLYYATQALSLNPNETKLYNNMGSALQTIHRYKDAMVCYETALLLDSSNVNAITNIATILDKQANYYESIKKYQEAIDLFVVNPNELNEIQYRMSFPLLGAGNLDLGWEYYDKGFEISGGRGRTPNRKFQIPQWNGKKIIGGKLLIWREQGLGDEVWFYSLIHEVLNYCENITIECSSRLLSLVQRAFPTCTVRIETPFSELADLNTFDFHIPVGSLCRIFRSSWENFSPSKGYLKPDAELLNIFSSRLASFQRKLLVGISWRSGNLLTSRNIHYAPISDWEPIFKVPNIQFVNLQYGECSEEIFNVKKYYDVDILNFEDIDLKNDLESVAAIIHNLDLVISVSTFISPFTQALGTPLMLINHKNWSMLGQSKWPWYESVKVYCPDNLSLPINSVFDKVVIDLLTFKKNGA